LSKRTNTFASIPPNPLDIFAKPVILYPSIVYTEVINEMPIYEYQCEECGEKFELLVRSSSRKGTIECPECGSERVHKAISLFSGVGGASSHTSGASCGPAPT